METKRKILNRHRKGDGIRKISREFNITRSKATIIFIKFIFKEGVKTYQRQSFLQEK